MRKEKKNTHITVNEERKTEKGRTLFNNRLFYEAFKMIINGFFLFLKLIRSAIFTF